MFPYVFFYKCKIFSVVPFYNWFSVNVRFAFASSVFIINVVYGSIICSDKFLM